MQDSDYLLPAAAALRAGISELAIHQAIEGGDLRTVTYKGAVRIPADELENYMDRMGTADDGPEMIG